MGRWLRCTYPNHTCRLFRNRGYCSTRSVHERLTVPDADAMRLAAPLDYRPDIGLGESVDKLNSDTDCGVAERAPGMTSRWLCATLFFSPLTALVKGYIPKGGYHDDTPGLIRSGFELFYTFVLIAKVIGAREREARGKWRWAETKRRREVRYGYAIVCKVSVSRLGANVGGSHEADFTNRE